MGCGNVRQITDDSASRGAWGDIVWGHYWLEDHLSYVSIDRL